VEGKGSKLTRRERVEGGKNQGGGNPGERQSHLGSREGGAGQYILERGSPRGFSYGHTLRGDIESLNEERD